MPDPALQADAAWTRRPHGIAQRLRCGKRAGRRVSTRSGHRQQRDVPYVLVGHIQENRGRRVVTDQRRDVDDALMPKQLHGAGEGFRIDFVLRIASRPSWTMTLSFSPSALASRRNFTVSMIGCSRPAFRAAGSWEAQTYSASISRAVTRIANSTRRGSRPDLRRR